MASTAQPFNKTLDASTWVPLHGDDNDSRMGHTVFFHASGSFWWDNKSSGNTVGGSPGDTGRASKFPAGFHSFDLSNTDLIWLRADTGTVTLEGGRLGVTAT
jgi:hypothetical protein